MAIPNPREIVRRFSDEPILTPKDVPYPCNSVFNTAATIHDGKTLLLFRAEDFRGVSFLGLATSEDGFTDFNIHPEPVLMPDPDSAFETRGVEDPRVTRLGEDYYITYTGYSRFAPLVCLSRTRDFLTYERLGAVTMPENKDAVLYPTRFNGSYAMMTRPVPDMEPRAHMWISYSSDLIHWGRHRCVMMTGEPGRWDAGKIGAGAPPILTDRGWLEIYHGVKYSVNTDIYRLGLALFDREDPARLIARSEGYILGPEVPAERTGDVPNVTFCCGATLVDGDVRIYYGTGDWAIGVAVAPLDRLFELLTETDRID